MSISKIKEINKAFDKKFTMSPDGVNNINYLFRINPDGSYSIALPSNVKDFYTQQILSLIEELIPKKQKHTYKGDDNGCYQLGYNSAIDQMRASIREFFEIKD